MSNLRKSSTTLTDEYFFNEALNFYRSGIVLSESDERIRDEYDLFSPIMYLFRHAVELMLKALIVKCLIKKNVMNWNEVKLHPHNRKISSMHSLRALYDTYIELLEQLNEDIPEVLSEIRLILDEFDNIDFSSAFFRYSFDKHGERNQKMMTEDVSDLVISMPCGLGNFIYHEGIEKFSCLHREQMIDDIEDDLKNVIEKLSRLYSVNTEYCCGQAFL